MSGPGLRHAFLRQTTAASHLRVEQVSDRAGFFASRTAYGDYLRRLHLFYARLDQALSGEARGLARYWGIMQRQGWLAEDLKALRLEPLPLSSGLECRPPRVDTRAHAIGCLYVLAGATLGSRVLVERIAPLDLPRPRGMQYLQGVGLGLNWAGFLDFLETIALDGTDTDLIALGEGAVAAFESISDHLSGDFAP